MLTARIQRARQFRAAAVRESSRFACVPRELFAHGCSRMLVSVMGVLLPPPVEEFSVASRARKSREAERSSGTWHFSRKWIAIGRWKRTLRNAKERRDKRYNHGEKMPRPAPYGGIIRMEQERIVPRFLSFSFFLAKDGRRSGREGNRPA